MHEPAPLCPRWKRDSTHGEARGGGGRRQLTSRKGLILAKTARQAAKHLLYPGHPQHHLAQVSRVQGREFSSCVGMEEKTQGLEESDPGHRLWADREHPAECLL